MPATCPLHLSSRQRGVIHLAVIGALVMASVMGYYFYHEYGLKHPVAPAAQPSSSAAQPPADSPAGPPRQAN